MSKKSFIALCGAAVLAIGIFSPIVYKAVTNTANIKEQKLEASEPEKTINLSFPVKGETVNVLKPQVVKYINDMHEQAKEIENDYVLHDFYAFAPDCNDRYYGQEFTNDTDLIRIKDYVEASINMSKSKLVSLVFDTVGFEEGTEFTVELSLNPDMDNPIKSITTDENFVNVNNLLERTTYYWQVSSGDVKSPIESFVTPDGWRMLSVGNVTNVRDMGGRPVFGNKHIKQGVIYRGGELVKETYTDSKSGSTHSKTLNAENIKILQDDMHIKNEVDFRGYEESNMLVESELKDADHPDIKYMRIDNMSAYDDFFEISASKEYYPKIKTLFQMFGQADEENALYFHCWGGADRTGTMGFVLGSLLGMSLTDLIIDFELTSFACNYRPHNIVDAKKVYSFPRLLAKVRYATYKGTKETYWKADKPISQIVADMLIDRLGVSQSEIDALRANLLISD